MGDFRSSKATPSSDLGARRRPFSVMRHLDDLLLVTP